MSRKQSVLDLWASDSDSENGGTRIMTSIVPNSKEKIELSKSHDEDIHICDDYFVGKHDITSSSSNTKHIVPLEEKFVHNMYTTHQSESHLPTPLPHDIDYKSLYFEERTKRIDLERKITKLESKLRELASLTNSGIGDPSSALSPSPTTNNTHSLESDDHWQEMIEQEKERKQKMRMQKSKMHPTNMRISSGHRSHAVIVDASSASTSSHVTADISTETMIIDTPEELKKAPVESLIDKNEDGGEDVAPTLRSSSHPRAARLPRPNHDHHRNGKLSLRRTQAALKSQSLGISSLQSVDHIPVKVDDKSITKPMPIKSNTKPRVQDSSWSSSDSDDDTKDEDSSWDESDNHHHSSAITSKQASLPYGSISATATSEAKLSAPTSISAAVLDIDGVENDSWSDSDSNSDHDIITSAIHKSSAIEMPVAVVEREVEAMVLKWAQSRMNIIHMFLTVHEVYHGHLPEYDSRWRQGQISIDDGNEIRKMYLKLARYCHPDKQAAGSPSIKIEAFHVFSALTDYYNLYKSRNDQH